MNGNKNLAYLIITIISVAVGVIYGFLYANAIIGIILPTILILSFVIALFAILALLGVILFGRRDNNRCVSKNGVFLLFGAVGTLIFSEITLAITASTIVIAVLLGITAYFTVFTILSLTKLIACLIQEACYCRD